MKRVILVTALIWLLAGSLVYSSVGNCIGDATYQGNLDTQVSGYLYASAWKQGTDTTYRADTATVAVPVGDCRRILIEYQWKMRNAFCAVSNLDSIKARNVYLWSNDQVRWFRLDSSAAITDTLWHGDTVIVRPYKWLMIVGYPSRVQVSVEDSLGQGISESNAIPANAYYRRLYWRATTFLIGKY